MNFLTSIFNAVTLFGVLGINFDPSGFIKMLPYMGVGMFVIFVLIGIIIMVTVLINELFSGRRR